RGGAPRAGVHRGARLFQLQLRGGDLDADPAGLAGQPRACAGVLWRQPGCPAAIVPDNLKSAVTKARRYEPELNPAYQEFAEHYGVAILPARVRKPRDKAKVETGVLIVERWILARLRNHTFFSLEELNAAIAALLEHFNTRPFKKMAGCRQARFIELDQPALRALPPRAYEFAEWKQAKVHPDYHIE